MLHNAVGLMSVSRNSRLDSAFEANVRQWLVGAPGAFVVFFLGTVLPTMVPIQAILLPRTLKPTSS